MEINNSVLIIKNTDIATNELDGKIVMMHIETGKYYNLDDVGTDIWLNIDHDITFENLVNKLLSIYNIDKETCENDTKIFLTKLQENKMIKLA